MCENIIYRQEMIYLFSFKVCIQCVYLLYLPNYLATYLPIYLAIFLFYLPMYLSSFLPTYLTYLPLYLCYFLHLPTFKSYNYAFAFFHFLFQSILPTNPLIFLHSYNRPTTFPLLSKLI